MKRKQVKGLCGVVMCEKEQYRTTGYCRSHARAMELYGDPLAQKQQQWHGLSVRERFLKYVKKTDTCWLWIGSKDKNGYGRLNIKDSPTLAHRLSWLLFSGASGIPIDRNILHKCDNPSCVNPEHLYVGTQTQNINDMYSSGRGYRRPGHRQSILTPDDIREIRASKLPGKFLAQDKGVSEATISEIRTGKIWRHVT